MYRSYRPTRTRLSVEGTFHYGCNKPVRFSLRCLKTSRVQLNSCKVAYIGPSRV